MGEKVSTCGRSDTALVAARCNPKRMRGRLRHQMAGDEHRASLSGQRRQMGAGRAARMDGPGIGHTEPKAWSTGTSGMIVA